MGKIYLRQSLGFTAGRSVIGGGTVTEKFFELKPDELWESTDNDKILTLQYALDASETDKVLDLSMFESVNGMIVKPDADLLIKITNLEGETQDIKVLSGRSSVLHAEMTGVKISNPSAEATAGSIVFIGV